LRPQQCHLTIHSSRSRFAARLNSGVRRCCGRFYFLACFVGSTFAIVYGRLRLAILKSVAFVAGIAPPLALIHHGVPIICGFGYIPHQAFRVRPQALGLRAPTPPATRAAHSVATQCRSKPSHATRFRAWLAPSVLVVPGFGYIGGRRRWGNRVLKLGSRAVTA